MGFNSAFKGLLPSNVLLKGVYSTYMGLNTQEKNNPKEIHRTVFLLYK